MDPVNIIEKYCDNQLRALMLAHGKQVARKALEIAKKNLDKNPDLKFIKEAALLHDIGMVKTDESRLFCHGELHYIAHGIEGKKILEAEGFPKHALVAERHIGVGLSKQDVIDQNLPLPKIDMIPKSIEEKIICLADKFFTKKDTTTELSIDEIRKEMARYNKVERLNALLKELNMG